MIVGASTSVLYVRELVPERGDPPIGQTSGQNLHEGMPHPGTGAVPQHEQAIGTDWAHEQRRDVARAGRRLEPVLGQLELWLGRLGS